MLYAAPYFGSMLLMPTYVQVLRADSALRTAALMIPGALALGVSVQVAARVLERLGPRRVVGAGLVLALLHGLALVAVLRPDTSYAVLGGLGVLQGLASGAVMMPTMASATRDLQGGDLASGAAILPLASTIANGIGTAVVSALFAAAIAWLLPAGSLASLAGLDGAARTAAVADLVDALRLTQAATLVVVLLALVIRLGGRRDAGRRRTTEPTPAGGVRR